MNSLVLQFVTEVRDHIDDSVCGFLSLEQDNQDTAVIHSIFRSFHTIKGTSAIFAEFEPITNLAHVAEDLMNCVRNAQVIMDTDKVDLFLSVLDMFSSWLDSIDRDGVLPVTAHTDATQLCASIQALLNAPDASGDIQDGCDEEKDQEDDSAAERRRILWQWVSALEEDTLQSLLDEDSKEQRLLALCYTPAAECFFYGEDPVNLFRQIAHIKTMAALFPEDVPEGDDSDPFSCHITLLAVVSDPTESLDAIFDYVSDQVSIMPYAEVLSLEKTYETAESAAPDKTKMEAEVTPSVSSESTPPPLGTGQKPAATFLRVAQSQANRLVNLVGEMIVAKNALPYLCRRAQNEYDVPALAGEIDQRYADITHVVEGLQEVAMEIRMLPVAQAFERFPRLVRDTSRKLDKKIILQMEGEDTCADKDVIEALSDPLIHMVRNSLDHGIESPQERLNAGKAEEGRILLRARQANASIVIEVCDDGKGIDPDVIRRKAEEKGIMSPEALAKMDDDEIIQLVMTPNFSTTEAVSDLSGRGVGMDVVHSMMTKLDGSIDLFSRLGEGTTVRLTLPLSMVITQVLTIRQNGCLYGIVSDDVITAMIDIPRSQVNTVCTEPKLSACGSLYPLYSLGKQLHIEHSDAWYEKKFSAVVVRVRGEEIALAIDELSDIVEVMVKPLHAMLIGNPFYSGNTILGDGSIVFILNMQGLIRYGY